MLASSLSSFPVSAVIDAAVTRVVVVTVIVVVVVAVDCCD